MPSDSTLISQLTEARAQLRAERADRVAEGLRLQAAVIEEQRLSALKLKSLSEACEEAYATARRSDEARIRLVEANKGLIAERDSLVEQLAHEQEQHRLGCLNAEAEREELAGRLRLAREALNQCRRLFGEIRGDWSDPRAECAEGRKLIDVVLGLPLPPLCACGKLADSEFAKIPMCTSCADGLKQAADQRDRDVLALMGKPSAPSSPSVKCTCDETYYCGCDDRDYAAKCKPSAPAQPSAPASGEQ